MLPDGFFHQRRFDMANAEPTERLLLDPQVREIIVSLGHDYWVKRGELPLQHGATSVTSVDCLAGRGLRGDRYARKRSEHKAQVTFIAWHSIQEVRSRFNLPDLPATVFRRNAADSFEFGEIGRQIEAGEHQNPNDV